MAEAPGVMRIQALKPRLLALACGVLCMVGSQAAAQSNHCTDPSASVGVQLPLQATFDTQTGDDGTHSLCGGGVGAPELLYRVTLTAFTQLEVRAEPESTFDAMIYVRAVDCDDPLAEFGCADYSGAGGVEVMRINLPGGDYYVFVDGSDPGDAGQVELTVGSPLPVEPVSWGAVKATYRD